jgi:hypothetical protein
MKTRQFALAFASTILMGAGPPPTSAPMFSSAAQPDAAPSIGSSHRLASTYFLDQHADGRLLTRDGYTSVVTFKNIKCTNTKGCNIGFNAMVQVLCRDTGTDHYGVAFYLVSEVNGAYGTVAPFQSRTAVYSHVESTTYYEPIGAPFILQNHQGVADGSTNGGAVQVEMIQTGGPDTPDCILGDWSVSIPFYSP